MSSSPILFARTIEADGTSRVLEGESIARTIESDNLAWVHLNALHQETRSWLQAHITYLDPIILDALLAEETRPRVTEYGDGVMLILRGMNLNEGAKPEDMISIRLWIDPHRIISIERRPLKAVQDVQRLMEEGRGPKNSGAFLSLLTHALFRRMEPIMQALDEQIDDIEEQVMEEPDKRLRTAIVHARKKAMLFRRYIAPQRDAIGQLRMSALG